MWPTTAQYLDVKQRIVAAGYQRDIAWSQGLKGPSTAEALAQEAIFVICNSGMRFATAQRIFKKVMAAIDAGTPVAQAFGHKPKVKAIEDIWATRAALLEGFRQAPDQVAWCQSLPWVGGITKFHLAKNLGVDCAKPDRWLVRIALISGEEVADLCQRVHLATGDRVATVDYVLWRACAIGVVKICNGTIELAAEPAPMRIDIEALRKQLRPEP